jgi:pilus assembly protein Flp/PilA
MFNFFEQLFAEVTRGVSIRDERGQTFVEYALLIGFIAIVALVAVQLLGTNVSSLFNSVANNL